MSETAADGGNVKIEMSGGEAIAEMFKLHDCWTDVRHGRFPVASLL